MRSDLSYTPEEWATALRFLAYDIAVPHYIPDRELTDTEIVNMYLHKARNWLQHTDTEPIAGWARTGERELS